MSNVVALLCACAVLASGASTQLCGSLVQPSCGVQSTGIGLLNGGLGQACGLYGSAYGGVGSGLLGGVGLGYGSQGFDALNVATGSSYAPNGMSVLADNLEIAGPVAVSGAYPILGTVSFGGNLPTGGQGEVSYSTASGVGLTSGGCGYGLASAQPSMSGLSVSNYGLSGVSGVNGLLGASQLGLSNSGCGCGNIYF